MKELEDTNCEIRRIVELQSSIWDRLNTSPEDDQSTVNGTYDAFESTKPLGGFIDGTNHAWLSYGTRLIVLNVRTGESISSWNFRYRISSVSPFPTQPGQLPLLLVGLDNDAHRIKESVGLICVFECTTSRILRVIRVPCGVEQICVISGGAEWEECSDPKTASILGRNSGIACVALRNLDHIIFDLQRSSWESVSSYLVADELSPYEIEFPQSKSTSSRHSCSKEKHSAYNLINSRIEKYIGFNRETFESMPLSQEKLSTTIINSRKIGCLISGCLGRVMLWQSDGAIGWISPHFDDNMSVSHLALIEPADDPRPFYYLWVACQDDSGTAAPVLRMYAMLFEKKYSEKETSFKLESDPSLKFEIELDEGDTINCLLSIERENNFEQNETGPRRGEESLLLIGTNNRMLLFDLNQWYKEQMPLTASECQNPNSILASYRTRSEVPNSIKDVIINSAYVPSSLKEFTNSGPNSLEELFFPNSLSFEWIELTPNQLNSWLTRGVQAELLRKIMITGPVILIQPAETFHRCLAAGLVPFSIECSFNSDHNAQREMLLSLCLEQRWANFLVKCAKEWSDGSASYLFPAFLRWGVQRGSAIKIYADQLSIPLFDQSGNNIGESETKTLRFCCQQLECLSSVVEKLTVESADFLMQQRALKRVAIYLQVLLWFHDVGLLPETQEVDESNLRIALSLRIPYPYERLTALYKEKREKLKAKRNNTEDDNLFIDCLISRECPSLRFQWEREGADVESVGHYPPPSLQSLLRSYLADCHQINSNEMENKHQITIYLLMDLAMLLQGSCPSIDQLIKYPAAFKLSPSLIKLTQAFWLLDHEDYQGFLDMMTGQLVSDAEVKDWHHKLVIKTLVHDNQHKLALMYLRVRKPPLATIEEQGTVISLSVEYGLVQSAFHCRPSSHYAQLLTRFFRACKSYGKLSEILHLALDKEEEEAFVKFLEEDKSEETKLLYYLQRCRHTEASSVSFGSRFTPQSEQSVSLNMFKAYNYTLPDITRRFTTSLNKRNPDMDSDFRYPRPMSHARSYNRAQEIHDTVVKKARETYNRGERTQIPFVSAPCMSLRCNSGNPDVNCVLFLERKAPVKRTIHQVQENEEVAESSGKKRRKLSDGRIVENKNEDKNLRNKTLGDKSELGIDALFSTPLVKRKTQFVNPGNTPIETPHSILKIRQMIKDSTSPNIITSQTLENTLESINEKKPRQIRFSVSQLQDDSLQNKSTDKESKKDMTNQNDSKEVIDEEASEMSEDSFFSPNISARSEESTILTDSSSYSRKSGPRPRPSLKRSTTLSSNDSSRRTSLKTASTSSIETPSSISPLTKEFLNSSANSLDFHMGKSPRERNPLLSASIYSSSVLSDSSYDENSRRFGSGAKGLDWEIETSFNKRDDLSPGKVVRITQSISVTSVTKTMVEEFEVDDEEGNGNEENNEKEDENERAAIDKKVVNEEIEEEVELSNRSEINKDIEMNMEIETENLSTKEIQLSEEITHNEISTIEKLTEPNGEVMVYVEEKVDETCKVSGIHEDTNKNILPERVVISTQERQSLSGKEKELEGESSDDLELLAMKDEEDDEDEVYESLSNSINSDVTNSLSTTEISNLSKQTLIEKIGFSKLVEDDFIITDDESLEVMNLNTSEEIDKTLQDKERGVDSNITDDESDRVGSKESEDHAVDFKGKSDSDLNEVSKSDSDSLGNFNNPLCVITGIDEPVLHQEKDVEDVSMKNVSLRRTPVRETRTRTSSNRKESKTESELDKSLVKDTPDPQRISSEFREDNIRKSSITREKTPVCETRAQKSLSTRKDSLTSQKSQTFEEGLRTPRRSQRASSVTKIVDEDITSNEGLRTPKRSQRAPSVTKIVVEDLTSNEGLRTPRRSQRASSVTKIVDEDLASNEVLRTPRRSQRASSVTKIVDENLTSNEGLRTPRSQRASSVTKIVDENLTSNKGLRTPKKSQRTSSVTKIVDEDLTSNEGLKTPRRSQRASSVTKIVDEDLPSNEGLKTPRRSQRASSVTKIVEKAEGLNSKVEIKDMEKKISRNKMLVRETKSQKSSASRNEKSQSEEVETEKVRTRRGSSLAKEILGSTVELGSKRDLQMSSGSESSVDTPPKRGRPRKAANVVQETSAPSSETEKEPQEATMIIRRSSRRAASVQKELTIIEEVAAKENKTVEEPIEVDISEPIKRNTRTTRGSSVTKEIPLPRITRASSLSKEIVEPSESLPRQSRRRGNSVPKEVRLVSSRTNRTVSISEEVIPEEPGEEGQESTTNLSLTKKALAEITCNPVTRKRTRCPSVQSIPEEIEEILSVPTKSRSTTRNQKKETLPRTRRAASVDLPVEPKRQTRSSRLKSSVIEEAILEEFSEADETKTNSRTVTKQPVRRKRAASETVAMEQKEEPETKSTQEKSRRGRKASQKSDDAEAEFTFSPPEKTNAPKDKEGISQVPNFVFSPPHTRSRQTGQPRRFISFIPTLTEEEEKEAALLQAAEAEKKSKEKEENKKPSRNPILKRYIPRKTFHLAKK